MNKLDLILEKINTMDAKINTMDKKINTMDQKINGMDADIKGIKITLENEVRPNIMRVAEGHLDLSRSLKDAMKSNNEYEMLTLRVNVLDSDVRELKCKIS
ncbi:MAG: hypothetical protein II994_08055 [Lachnospiraceae bacterium]|nr:hypothetical protein [Lachnospiraceae bacterium]